MQKISITYVGKYPKDVSVVYNFIIANHHCVKSVRIRSFSGPHFLAFGLNTERYFETLSIQSKCGKIWTRKTPNTDNFQAVHMNTQYSTWWISVFCNVNYVSNKSRKFRTNLLQTINLLLKWKLTPQSTVYQLPWKEESKVNVRLQSSVNAWFKTYDINALL